MAAKTLSSLGSFRTVASEDPEERYRRLTLKYGKDLHDAVAKKDQLLQERRVNNWLEVFVLLRDQKNPRPVVPISVKSRNGRIDPLLAAGIIHNPAEEAMLRKAAMPSSGAKAKVKNQITISKQDRELCKQWLVEAVQVEQTAVDQLLSEGKTEQAANQKSRLADLLRQIEELEAVDKIKGTESMTISFGGDSIFDERVKRETKGALAFAALSFLVMLISMYFLK